MSASPASPPVPPLLSSLFLNTIKNSLIGTFVSDGFEKEITKLLFTSYGKEVAALVHDTLTNFSTKDFDYETFDMLEYIIDQCNIKADEILAILIDRKDFSKLLNTFRYQVFDIINKSTDEFFIEKIFKRYSKELFKECFEQIAFKVCDVKNFVFSEDEVKLVIKYYKDLNKNSYYGVFRSWITVFKVLSKSSKVGRDYFKEKYIEALDLATIEKNPYKRLQMRYGLIRAIKDVRDKPLRRDFIRAMLVKQQGDFNAALLKYYPRYTKYIPMS